MQNKIIKSSEVYNVDHWWLNSRHIFSFANYFDPNNLAFGNMRVFNDDIIAWNSGFWKHPHYNMEILTIVLDNEISHSDSMWNTETIQAGEIQTMSAGSGVFHSEQNMSDKDTNLFQIWFIPNNRDTEPRYKDQKIDLENNSLTLLAENNPDSPVGYLDTNVLVYRWKYQENQKFDYELKEWKWLFLYMISWKIKDEQNILETRDQLRYVESWKYNFEILENSDFVLIEVEL